MINKKTIIEYLQLSKIFYDDVAKHSGKNGMYENAYKNNIRSEIINKILEEISNNEIFELNMQMFKEIKL